MEKSNELSLLLKNTTDSFVETLTYDKNVSFPDLVTICSMAFVPNIGAVIIASGNSTKNIEYIRDKFIQALNLMIYEAIKEFKNDEMH